MLPGVEPYIADILANPADDAARLILADWLQEQGIETDGQPFHGRTDWLRLAGYWMVQDDFPGQLPRLAWVVLHQGTCFCLGGIPNELRPRCHFCGPSYGFSEGTHAVYFWPRPATDAPVKRWECRACHDKLNRPISQINLRPRLRLRNGETFLFDPATASQGKELEVIPGLEGERARIANVTAQNLVLTGAYWYPTFATVQAHTLRAFVFHHPVGWVGESTARLEIQPRLEERPAALRWLTLDLLTLREMDWNIHQHYFNGETQFTRRTEAPFTTLPKGFRSLYLANHFRPDLPLTIHNDPFERCVRFTQPVLQPGDFFGTTADDRLTHGPGLVNLLGRVLSVQGNTFRYQPIRVIS